ncbi:TetR/AcrR family transcriptional regulator [Xenorhabdus thuongxuanensis]|uniref:Putative HTH-type transcriptional regulator n=1 Tax=Xenorhabdus thuongxuanensis TaxID=1873484 RepID=A0A1Q5U7Q9_9GAMM|nr:TetR/AcrR family transcriptional regulator [Xenorhabdus thuongxuanensis]OKP08484.1 putative HTH-type transcriptional regulator [Xenorhabdus thuongxuanensis]
MLSPTRSGRPRSAAATKAVLTTALELAHIGGIQHVTIERIAQHANVAKSTIYRRWPNASAVVMDAFLQDIESSIIYQPTTSTPETVKQTIQSLINALSGKRGKLLRYLIGVAQRNEELQKAFIQQWIEPRRQLGIKVLNQAINRGELHSSSDPELILDMLYGALYYRMIISFTHPDSSFVNQLVDRVFHGLYQKHADK